MKKNHALSPRQAGRNIRNDALSPGEAGEKVQSVPESTPPPFSAGGRVLELRPAQRRGGGVDSVLEATDGSWIP